MNKYYTPDISEFHVGFRYEEGYAAREGTSSEWYEREVKDQYELEDIGRHEELRVKWLDEKDIEELDFQYAGASTDL